MKGNQESLSIGAGQ